MTASVPRPVPGRRPPRSNAGWSLVSLLLMLLAGLVLVAAALVLTKGSRKPESPAPVAARLDTPLLDGKLSANEGYVLALDESGFLYGWGSATNLDQPGAPQVFDRPTRGGSPQPWREIRAGTVATYALRGNGELWRIAPRQRLPNAKEDWEYANLAQSVEFPLFDPELRWRRALESWGVGAGIDTAGKLWYWVDKELRNPLKDTRPGPHGTPTQLGLGQTFIDLCSAGTRVYAIDQEGALWGTGDLTGWRKGSGITHPAPDDGAFAEKLRPIEGASHLEKLFCTRSRVSVFALDRNGGLWEYGAKREERSGGGFVWHLTQANDQRWATLALNTSQVFAIATDGSLWQWDVFKPKPVLLDNQRRWVAVAAANDAGAALSADGQIYTWGGNHSGQLGDGSVAKQRDKPTPVFSAARFAKTAD